MQPRLPPLFTTIGTLAPVLLLMSGCSLPAVLLGHFESPMVTLSASKVESLDRNRAVIGFGLTVRNANAFGLSTRGIRYRMSVRGHVLADGRGTGRVTVPPRAAAIVDLHLEVPFTALAAAAPDAVMFGEIPYELDGALVVGSFVSAREVPFSVSSVLRINLPIEMARLPRSSSPAGGAQVHAARMQRGVH